MISHQTWIYKDTPQLIYQDTLENKRLTRSDSNSEFSKCVREGFKMQALLSGPHTQLIMINSLSSSDYSCPYYVRESLVLKDGVCIGLDYKRMNENESAPLVIICHGLGGDSENGFMYHYCDKLSKYGYVPVVVVRRGHGDLSLLPSPRKPNETLDYLGFPRLSDDCDFEQVMEHLSRKFPGRKKILLGISAGGDIVTRYCKNQRKCKIDACISISNGNDIDSFTEELDSKRRLIGKLVIYYLINLYNKKINQIRMILESKKNVKIDLKKILNVGSIREFERELMLPLCIPGTTLHKFYDMKNSHKGLEDIDIPFLTISSWDDPFIPCHCHTHPIIAATKNPNIICLMTQRGGHTGWIESYGQSWIPKIVHAFIDSKINTM